VGGVVALGERHRVDGWALAGVTVIVAEAPDAVRRAWRGLLPETALVLLTPAAAEALADELTAGAAPLTAVMPG
jgi:vacuolar-type H+-ATPase subunit F/Vma7